MALIYCSECGHQVSDKAPACPNCGAPIFVPTPVVPEYVHHKEESGSTALIVLGYVFSALSLLIFPFIFGIIGLIFGIINAVRGNSGHGAVQIFISVISIIWAILIYF